MPKNKQQKQAVVGSLTASLKSAKGVVFANFQGLKVAQSEELRRLARTEGVVALAAKKTLVKRALQDIGLEDVDPSQFSGGISVFTSTTDEIAPARIVNAFAKTNTVVTLFGGLLNGAYIDAVGVKNLANLPSKKELLGKLVGTMQAPVSGFVNVLAGNLRGLVRVLSAYQEKKSA